jgi:hypothetical protein
VKILFKDQEDEEKLKDIIHIWENCKLPTEGEIEDFYKKHYK